uniref:Putative Glycerol-3-phosphate dehydrogenase (NAD(P)+) 1 (NAD(P)H-dependent glycerol-3-phosphate dehydrogenase 1) gpsA1 n=1 Tax=mine drainage metagenome TaxID=410659 RepID=E6PWJ7_9ZZZZ
MRQPAIHDFGATMDAVCATPPMPQGMNEARSGPSPHIAVLGAGAWGTALAAALQRSGSQVTLWARRPDLVHALRTQSSNPRHLPGITLPPGLRATTELAEALAGARLVVLALPSAALRETAQRAAPLLAPDAVVLAACKGFERQCGALPTEVLRDCCDDHALLGVLSGPSFADEVARGLPTRLTLALPALLPSHAQAQRAHAFALGLRQQLAGAAIMLELTDDAVAAQVGGALKNLVAIASGMAMAQGLGENARAAIVTLGLDDMRRLTLALGGRSQTLLSSCGVGDLFLTAASAHSRNTRLGLRLGRGDGLDASAASGELTEGAIAALSVQALERRLGLRLHVAACVREVLLQHGSAPQALARLLHDSPAQVLPEEPVVPAAAPAQRGGRLAKVARLATAGWSQRPAQ